MKIAFASKGDPRSLVTWSGIPAHIFSALEENGHEVIPITLLAAKDPWYYNWLRRFYFRTQKRWFLAEVEERYLRVIGSQFDDEVARIQPEVVIVIHGDWLAYTSFPQPVCIIHDTTFEKLIDYYPAFSKLTYRSIKMGKNMYQRALLRADASVFSSKWASESAISDYSIPASKVHTIPFGANLVKTPDHETIKNWIAERSKNDSCNFLFLGVDWKRKGGPEALRFVTELNRRGIKSRLIIVGCVPQIPVKLEIYVHKVGFLRKSNESEANILEGWFKSSHALLLPSLAECYGCVYCEANAYGLPSLGRDTGGVSEIIKDGVNGLLIKADESPEALAARWENIWSNRRIYSELSLNSRKEFDERLNYCVFLNKLEKILSDLT